MGITAFPAYTGCVLHLLFSNNANHKVYYMRNPTGNAGHCGNTSIENDASGKTDQVFVFPNPASEILNIAGEYIDNGNYKFILKNELEQIVLFDNTVIENNSIKKSISISEIPDGIYFLTIDNEKTRIVKKIIKLKQ
jgi:hypothetical protein